MDVDEPPRRRVRVFGCCLPIPLAFGVLSAAALAVVRKRSGWWR